MGVRKLVRRHWIDAALALLVFGASLAVYHATLTPSLSYKSPDGNELATIPYILGLAHATGYPLYTWLGKLFTFLPVGDVAHRVNLMSAVLGAAGVGLFYGILRLLLGRSWRGRLAAGFAALLFAFSRTFWSQTGIAEVYASNLFMLALTLLLLLLWARAEERDRARRPAGQAWWRKLIPAWRPALLLFLAALSLGLSLGTHMSSLGFAPAMALFVLLVSWPTALSPAGWAAGGLGFGLGALQFLWLPFKANTLNDPLMVRNAPNTWRSFYSYTLGAFPQFKFAFGWEQVPDRMVIYLALLVGQYGLVGTLLGLLGMWVALFRRPKRFFLIMGMYLVHVAFFSQYAVFDLDVFFIPAHFLFAIFIGWGLWGVLEWLAAGSRWLLGRIPSRNVSRLVRAGLIALAVLALARGIGREVRANWEHNDYSEDVAINDFYENVFLLLPEDSVLLGRGGVFGYDMFYYRLVYDVRPDVSLPHIAGTNLGALELEGRPVFTNERPGAGRRSPWSLPADLLPADSWTVPVLLGPTPERHGLGGGRAELILWQVVDTPPELVVPAGRAAPQNQLTIPLSGKTLVGYDLEAGGEGVQAGRAVHLTLYWQIERADNLRVRLALDGESLLSYEIGFGNLPRYAEEHGLTSTGGQLVVDDFWLVIPRTAEAGPAVLEVGDAPPLNPLLGLGDSTPSADLTELMIGEAAPLLNWE
jgi:hypothetical protein